MTATREIEVKYRLSDRTTAADALGERGVVWSPPVVQDDQAYAPQSWSYGMSKVGVAFARLRTQDDACVFTVKVPGANEMACAEHETTVDDRSAMHGALLAMGWVPTVRIVKTRRTARLGELSLCLDEVQHAGAFLEVEVLASDDKDDLAAQERLDRFVTSLGITGQRVTDTYDSLVRAAVAAV